MIIKTIIITAILVTIIMLALGVKLLFDKSTEFTAHSCSVEDSGLVKNGVCSNCQLKDLNQF